MRRILGIVLLLTLCSFSLFACGGNPSPATQPKSIGVPASVPSTSFQLTGDVSHPGTFRLTDLQALPKVTVITTSQPLGTHTFGGVLLSSFLQQAELITASTRKNDILRLSAVVMGTDHYSAAVALGEILPQFANKQVLLAYEEDGKPLAVADGFVRLVVPGDAAAGRYVSNVMRIDIGWHGPAPRQGPAGASSALYLDGQVNKPAKYDLSAIAALSPTQMTIQSAGANGQAVSTTYSGVLLNTLLTQAGVILGAQKNGILRLGIVAIGSDGYSALIAGGEIAPKFANLKILVATSANGQPLSNDGFARLIVPGDQAMGRFVSNLVELQVVSLATS